MKIYGVMWSGSTTIVLAYTNKQKAEERVNKENRNLSGWRKLFPYKWVVHTIDVIED